tara:strand:- start:13978 stop:14691 length:714 start_codon:yes stop_codon:yes gene_type:complete
MKTVDEIWDWATEVNPDVQIEKLTEYITIARNVYKHPDRVLEFQKLLTKWESFSGAKPGVSSLPLPAWTGKHIINNVFGDHDENNYILDSSEPEFLYFYKNNKKKFDSYSLSERLYTGNCLLPHHDTINDDIEERICLVNLNHKSIETGFWSFNNEVLLYEKDMSLDCFEEYSDEINLDNYYEKTNNGILDQVLTVEYNFNEAIFYNARALHNPVIDDFFTRENPRTTLRVKFTYES